ncbi:hypothetical protein HRE53_06315 [Acaryochloris sp. 'Moss Beach']|uniref:hypothetical protein n=1 Tax=Acaryochloris sp. 'Moss Beach' TaxID=2740837 RepID=UPI001F351708|nr:hypothetical protein [Acaryochloris sp. 'Moss Beach']UJB70678.1 hypothetical protein HRE53_06315 [Acaryochloris sp. 'Moss Beach']
MQQKTQYLNTDLELRSHERLTMLCHEFEKTCCILNHIQADNEHWHATIESNLSGDSCADLAIQAILAVLPQLSAQAKRQWDNCYLREFDLGFECGDTWAYPYALTAESIRLIAEANCSLSVTLYPVLNSSAGARQ